MARDPWTDPDPQPSGFDADLAAIRPRYVEAHIGNPNTRLTIVAGVQDEDTEPLQQPATDRHGRPASAAATKR